VDGQGHVVDTIDDRRAIGRTGVAQDVEVREIGTGLGRPGRGEDARSIGRRTLSTDPRVDDLVAVEEAGHDRLAQGRIDGRLEAAGLEGDDAEEPGDRHGTFGATVAVAGAGEGLGNERGQTSLHDKVTVAGAEPDVLPAAMLRNC
jgi:hypothetical protein